MNSSDALHSLTDFKRRTSDLVKQMRKSHQPLVLTVKGRAELVVQTADDYRQMLEDLEKMQAIEGIRRGLESMESKKSRPASEIFGELEAKYSYLRR